jgi:hypothetical protein
MELHSHDCLHNVFYPLVHPPHHIFPIIISPLTKTAFQLIRWSCNVPGITFLGGTRNCNIQVVVATSHFGNWSCISHPFAGMISDIVIVIVIVSVMTQYSDTFLNSTKTDKS